MSEGISVSSTLGRLKTELLPWTDTPEEEARLILQKISGLSAAALLSHPEKLLSAAESREIERILHGRIQGEPLPYLLGSWEFFGLPFVVTPDTLIPRPETELLVEQALRWIAKRGSGEPRMALDVGAGSGCIALSLLHAWQNLHAIATDISMQALKVARLNAIELHVSQRLRLVQCHLAEPLSGAFDIVCANLPYIPTRRCQTLEVAKHEPMLALDGGEDGFALYRALFLDIKRKLAPCAALFCEIEYSQKNIALQVAKSAFPSSDIEVMSDFSGLPRLLIIKGAQTL